MKKASAITVILIFLLSPICALAEKSGSPEQPFSPQQAIGHQGHHVTVEGIASVRDADGLMGTYVWLKNPKNVLFVGYVSVNNKARFPDLQNLDGKKIDITGVVETFNSIPMIRLTSANQIRMAG
jgi:hypothetical protein